MSELNPHIVKEHEGDYENTIQYFVTGRPLTEEEMLPDSHGVHPVSPLGFMLREDGTPLLPTEPLSGFSAYNVFHDCQACGGTGMSGDSQCQACGGTGHEKCSTCDGTGQVEDETTHLMVECPDCQGIGSVRYTAQEAYEESYKVSGKYYMFGSDAIAFPVLDIHRSDDGTQIIVTVKGLLPTDNTGTVYFKNMTTDDYTPTGLVGDDARFDTLDSVTHDAAAGTTEIAITTDIVFDGVVVEGKLAMCIDTEEKFLTISDPDSDTLSGIYLMGETEGEPIRKVFNWYGIQDSESGEDGKPACYASNGYSDTEVERWVSAKMEGVIRHGCHPSSEAGDLRGAGGLVSWFTSCGNVDISGGAGQNAVLIPGFGLGYGYYNGCPGGDKAHYTPDPDESSERKWLVFGYGTKRDAFQADVGKTALPLDWPFTDSSSYADDARDNNITLVRDWLARTSRECSRCNGTGVVIEDGRTRPCTHCGATGEEPDCQECHGTGEVEDETTHEMVTCPECNGQGFCGGHRYLMDKVHVCLYNDFKPNDDGTTVLKKTFVNLATPITQKDGDSFEVTVSLPNIGLNEAYSDDMLKNLSGYYAYVSQPRVYVVSGTWDFSDTRVTFTTKDFNTFELGEEKFKDRNGDDLAGGTDVRVKFIFEAYTQKKFSGIGTLSGGRITLTEPLDIPATAMRRITRSADSEGNIHGSICGAAYVEPNNDTVPGDIATNLGLNAVRNESGALGNDNGDGGEKSLEEFNKFYTADTDTGNRHHVLFDKNKDGEYAPLKDQRQIVATVYPTVTNTFPWSLTHRRKLGFLDKIMTMDADAGVNSLFYRVYRMNRDILESMSLETALPVKDYPLDMQNDLAWAINTNSTERERLSVIGALVTIVGDANEVSTAMDAQPVRRALQAAKLLSGDYKSARVSRLGSFGTSDKFTGYVTGSKIRTDGSEVTDYSDLGELIDVVDGNEYDYMANAVRLRHLPVVLASAGDDPYTAEPFSPVLDAYPYIGEDHDDYAYYRGNPYGYGEFDTTARTEEIPCEVSASTGTEVFSMSNSVVQACIKAGIVTDPDIVSDLYRSAELHAVDFGDALAADNVNRPHVYRDGDGSDVSWMEAIDAFTKLISPDNIPVPEPDDYSSLFAVGDNDEQFPFIMADAYGYYKILNGWEGDDEFIATTMPTDDDLAMFLKEYVPSYAARLAVRNWDSYRVKVENGASESGDTTYLTRMKWYDPDCDAASRGIYASDAFLVGEEFSDMNLNRIEFADAEEAISLNCSVPPYTVKHDYNTPEPFATETDKYSVSYIRVFMKFVFSEDAGRWYCVDYRQAPVSYLSPLYGAKALDQTINGKRLWIRPECERAGWTSTLTRTYEEYQPLDINPELAHAVTSGERRLMVPYLPEDEGGIGLNAPVNKYGTNTLDDIKAMPHANFWSVREHLRPATGAVACGDIPRYYKENDEWVWGDTGGIMSDAVLWGQYDYPTKGGPDYHLPDTEIPDADLRTRILIYAKKNNGVDPAVMDTGDVQVGSGPKVISVSYGSNSE